MTSREKRVQPTPRETHERSSTRPKVAVTGSGIVSSLGLGVEEFWASLLAGRSARAPHPASSRGIPVPSDAGLVGDVTDRARELLASRRLRRVSRLALHSVAAAHLALRGATGANDGSSLDGPAAPDPDSTAVVLGTSFGSSEYHFEYYESLYRGGLRDASPLLFSESVMNAATGHVALHFGLRGPSLALVGGEEVGLTAIADSMDRLALGEVNAAFAGGGDESCDFVQAGLERRGFLSSSGNDGTGFFSEGAGFLFLEREEDVRAAGRRVLARLSGYGIVRPPAAGDADREEATVRAIQAALLDAGVDSDAVSVVIASTGGSAARDLQTADRGLNGMACPVVRPGQPLGEGFAYTSAALAIIAVEALRTRRVPAAWTASAAVDEGESACAPLDGAGHGVVVASNRLGGATAIVLEAGEE